MDKFGLLPRAMFDTFHAAAQARSVMIATKLGIFDLLSEAPKSTRQIASATSTDERALEKLLQVLLAGKYLRLRRGKWELRSHVRRWVVRSSRSSIADQLLHGFVQWDAIENFEQFIRTGKPRELHDRLTPKDWPAYMRGMKCIARLAVGEVVSRTRLPHNPRRMLDIGGSHGLYSTSFCRQYPTLQAEILDLPVAVQYATPLLEEDAMGSRVTFRPGDALTDSLGDREWDFIFVSQLLHHFTAEMNQALCERIARALKPGGVFAILEVERRADHKAGQIGSILDLYFAASSRSGTWSVAEMQSWQARTGMIIGTPIRLWAVPGIVIVRAEVPPVGLLDQESPAIARQLTPC